MSSCVQAKWKGHVISCHHVLVPLACVFSKELLNIRQQLLFHTCEANSSSLELSLPPSATSSQLQPFQTFIQDYTLDPSRRANHTRLPELLRWVPFKDIHKASLTCGDPPTLTTIQKNNNSHFFASVTSWYMHQLSTQLELIIPSPTSWVRSLSCTSSWQNCAKTCKQLKSTNASTVYQISSQENWDKHNTKL